MKHENVFVYMISAFAIILTSLAIVAGAGRIMIIYKQSASQKSVLRGVESINNSIQAVVNDFSNILSDASEQKYEDFCKLTEGSQKSFLKETEIENYFKLGVISEFEKATGDGEQLREHIIEVIPKPMFGSITVDENNLPYIYVEKSEDGTLLSASVKNVNFIYKGIPGITRNETIDFSFDFPEAVFYAGNEDVFEYSMMASKGIYVSGETSSFVGNIYAGSHSPIESRDAEVAYGEIGEYGGLNFLATQVGIEADSVVSEGDINLNGSFVIFNPENSSGIKCYANKIRKMRGYVSDSIYSITGDFYGVKDMPESEMSFYASIKDTAKTTLLGIAEIPFYYDSNNDKSYEGEYRKIISSEDVEITEDITGIIFTSGNVIVNAGCNVEGLILCADRIYLLGNNSIVANSTIVKKIIADEITENNSEVDDEVIQDSDEFGSEIDSGIVYHALDYIGGLDYPGLKSPNYYVIPYQE